MLCVIGAMMPYCISTLIKSMGLRSINARQVAHGDVVLNDDEFYRLTCFRFDIALLNLRTTF